MNSNLSYVPLCGDASTTSSTLMSLTLWRHSRNACRVSWLPTISVSTKRIAHASRCGPRPSCKRARPVLETVRLARSSTSTSFFTEQIERRRVEPSDDMNSAFLAADPEGVGLTAEEILGYMFVMIAGGNDTAIGLLAGGAELFARHPDERARLIADPALIPNAVQEMLRLTSPVQGLCRVSTHALTLHNTTLPAGSRVMFCYAAANRYPREFGPDADELNVGRSVPRYVALGSGPHFCLGAAAARLQGRIVFEELLARCPDFAGGSFTRRHETLPFTPR